MTDLILENGRFGESVDIGKLAGLSSTTIMTRMSSIISGYVAEAKNAEIEAITKRLIKEGIHSHLISRIEILSKSVEQLPVPTSFLLYAEVPRSLIIAEYDCLLQGYDKKYKKLGDRKCLCDKEFARIVKRAKKHVPISELGHHQSLLIDSDIKSYDKKQEFLSKTIGEIKELPIEQQTTLACAMVIIKGANSALYDINSFLSTRNVKNISGHFAILQVSRIVEDLCKECPEDFIEHFFEMCFND